ENALVKRCLSAACDKDGRSDMGDRPGPAGRIDTIERVSIGGTEQWISIRTRDAGKPILLFLHGGPGTAQISFSRKSQRALEDDFIVVNWYQRGAGRSYRKGLKKEDMTIGRILLDAEELVLTLLARFGQSRLFLVGQSWGSVIGIKLCAKRPDLIWGYLGVGQVVDMHSCESISYSFTLREAERLGNRKAVDQLTKIGSPPYRSLSDAGVQRHWLAKFHGATARGSMPGILVRNTSLRDTSPRQLVKFVRGAIFSLKCLDAQLNEVSIREEIPVLEVAVFFCTGRRDYTVPHELVVEYCEALTAPGKEVIWFESSAHLPNFEEPRRFCDVCCDVRDRVMGQ
ncbi:MAG: alpha/beta fold hydrolase, partial [Caulobacteraceae bacterium]